MVGAHARPAGGHTDARQPRQDAQRWPGQAMSSGPSSMHSFRCQIIRAVAGVPAAETFIVADDKALDALSRDLADWKPAREAADERVGRHWHVASGSGESHS